MRISLSIAFVALFSLSSIAALAQIDPSSRDARAVFEASHDRDAGDRAVARLRMVIDDRSGGRRERAIRVRSMEVEGATKTRMIFESPADIRNTGLLTFDYDDGDRSDDQWLFLPSLHRVTRVAGSNRSSSFAGSDFSFADLTRQDPDRYRLRLAAADVEVGGQSTWHLEATPLSDEIAEETGYRRFEIWISKRSLIPLRFKGYMESGRVKYVAAEDVSRIDGVWTARRLIARTVRNGEIESETVLERRDVRYGDPSVTEADFTAERLRDGL